MKTPPLSRLRLQNFKAVRDSGHVDFGWLTVFVGNNGSGKSSLVEGLQTFRDVVDDGVDAAFRPWRGFEHVWNKAVNHELQQVGDRPHYTNPLAIEVHWQWLGKSLRLAQQINQGVGGDVLFIQHEQAIQRRLGRLNVKTPAEYANKPGSGHVRGADSRLERWTRNDDGEVSFAGARGVRDVEGNRATFAIAERLSDGQSMLKRFAPDSCSRWQFLAMNPDQMGQPKAQARAGGNTLLAKDGSNIAEYLNSFRQKDLSAFESLLDSLRYVLPYAGDLQPGFTSELERAFYLKFKEQHFELPGWLLSTGTLRIVGLLACLRHPDPPPLLIVEEIENGLDPRTLHLLVEEIRAAIAAGKTQVIITTHSPYLLDLLDLSQIVVVQRRDGQPTFTRPNVKDLAQWAKNFAPGRLYTMGRLTQGEGE